MADSTNQPPRITEFRHPAYSRQSLNWQKWRFVYAGGDDFIDEYLEQYSNREDLDDFNTRRRITPAPSFAKAAINDIKNSIFQRMCDVTRTGGSKTYMAAVEGQENGVDLHGSSMNEFLGRLVLPELLTMAKVGVYVDMPENPGNNLLEAAGKKPYIYMYRAESILSWTMRPDKADEYGSVLLLDYVDDCDQMSGLPFGQWARYRHVWLAEDGKVHVRYYDDEATLVDKDGNATIEEMGEYILDIDFIPFVALELNDSLLSDVANHQIALLNMESSDVMYSLKSNFPFYIERQDQRQFGGYTPPNLPDGTGAAQPNKAGTPEIEVGTMQGRAYTGDTPPNFINPSSEPLEASMAKQKQLKDDIRQLVNLALSNAKPKMASAESKSIDERGLEAGLSYIGLELQHAERKIGLYWSAYERAKEIPTVTYPEKYSLLSDEDRRAVVKQLEELRDSVPSKTLNKIISSQIAMLLVGNKISVEEMTKIDTEIKNAKAFSADPAIIDAAVTGGYCSKELAAELLGYPDDTVTKADKEHVDRLKAIAETQAPAAPVDNPAARGLPDLSGSPGADANAEKASAADQTTKPTPTDTGRGEGKNNAPK